MGSKKFESKIKDKGMHSQRQLKIVSQNEDRKMIRKDRDVKI